jgi:extradiol dioxygenase family protein
MLGAVVALDPDIGLKAAWILALLAIARALSVPDEVTRRLRRQRHAGTCFQARRKARELTLPQAANPDETRINSRAMNDQAEALQRSTYPRFHLAFPVTDLAKARAFYGEFLACREGRSSAEWVDFDFYGHQIVAHKVAAGDAGTTTNPVDGHNVPVRHFGVILSMAEWRKLAETLQRADIAFVIKPHIRFAGEPGEQATMFFLDPFGNALEFKAFQDMGKIFAK